MGEGLFWILFGLIAAPLGAIGVLMLAGGVRLFIQRVRLMLFGERAIGVVVEISPDTGSTDEPSPTELELAAPGGTLQIAFTDGCGVRQIVSPELPVSQGWYQCGDEVQLLYQFRTPETAIIDHFGVLGGAPLLPIVFGLALCIPVLALIGHLWPPMSDWLISAGRAQGPWLIPCLTIGTSLAFFVLGIHLTRTRLRRRCHDARVTGRIVEQGWSRGSSRKTRWIRVAYRDEQGIDHTRMLPVTTGLLARDRQEGQTVELLFDPDAPLDVLVNEPLELWLLPLLVLFLGAITSTVFTWAWWTGMMI